MSYISAKKQDGIVYESALRVPLIEFAHGYGWDCECELKLKNDTTRTAGAFKKIDFAIAYNNQFVGIELKLVKSASTPINISRDIFKLAHLLPIQDRVLDFSHIYGFVLVVSMGPEFLVHDENRILKDKVWTESCIIGMEGKKNIFEVGESFETSCTIGRKTFTSKIWKVKQ